MAKSNYITRNGWNVLDQELKFLWREERPKVTQAVSEAAALGDRSENAEYIYGKRRLREIDRSMEEAAMDLGAKPWKVFFLITVPMIAPSLAAGAMMSFALSLDDLVLASFVSGPGSTTLPMEIFSAVRMGVKPEINAIASLILLFISMATFLLWFFTRRAEKNRKKAMLQIKEQERANQA